MPVNKVSKAMRQMNDNLEKVEERLRESKFATEKNTKELQKIHEARAAAEQKLFEMEQKRIDEYKPRPLVRTSPVGLRIHEIELLNLHQGEVSRINHNHDKELALREQEIEIKEQQLEHAEYEIEQTKRKLDII
jgi:uncharacterized protein (DUF3084 family)